MTEQQAAEISRRWARYYFRRFPHIKGSLEYLGTNNNERIQRIDTFAEVINRLNHLLDNPTEISPECAHVIQLKTFLGNRKIPSLENILAQQAQSINISDAIQKTIQFGKKEFPSWANKEYQQPTIPAVGIFLEGLGYYLGLSIHATDQEKVLSTKRTFVLSFEEVLFTEHPNSLLLSDVIDFMKDEKQDFPAPLQNRLY